MSIFNNTLPIDHYLLSSSIQKVKSLSQNITLLLVSSSSLTPLEKLFLTQNSSNGHYVLYLIHSPSAQFPEGSQNEILASLGAQFLHIYSTTITNPPPCPFFVTIDTSGKIISIARLSTETVSITSNISAFDPLSDSIPSFDTTPNSMLIDIDNDRASTTNTTTHSDDPLPHPPLYSSLQTLSNLPGDSDGDDDHEFNTERTPLRTIDERLSDKHSGYPSITIDPTHDPDSINVEYSLEPTNSSPNNTITPESVQNQEPPKWKIIRNYLCCGCGFCSYLSIFHWIPLSFWQYPPDNNLWMYLLEHHTFEGAPEPMNSQLFGSQQTSGPPPPPPGSGPGRRPPGNGRGNGSTRRTGMVSFSQFNNGS